MRIQLSKLLNSPKVQFLVNGNVSWLSDSVPKREGLATLEWHDHEGGIYNIEVAQLEEVTLFHGTCRVAGRPDINHEWESDSVALYFYQTVPVTHVHQL